MQFIYFSMQRVYLIYLYSIWNVLYTYTIVPVQQTLMEIRNFYVLANWCLMRMNLISTFSYDLLLLTPYWRVGLGVDLHAFFFF